MSTQPQPRPAESLYAPYVQELREFFATSGLAFGTPECIFAIDERLRTSPPFFEDLSSLARSIILRQGGSMPHAELLHILALAVGGAEMEQAPQVYRQPLRQLLSFVTGVLRRPWNQPPGERAEVFSFPSVAADPSPVAAPTARSTTWEEPVPALREKDGPTSPGSRVLQPPPPALEVHFVPAARWPELQQAVPETKEPQEFREAEPQPPVSEQLIQQPVAAVESMPPSAVTFKPPVLRSPTEEEPAPLVLRGVVPVASAAAVSAMLLVVALHHYSSSSHHPQPGIAKTPPAAEPAQAQAATTSTVDPVSPAKPAAEDEVLARAPTRATRRRSSTRDDYVAPPTYHSYLIPSNPAPPAAAPGSATQVTAPAQNAADPGLASTPRPSSATVASTQSSRSPPAAPPELGALARMSSEDPGELSAPGHDSPSALSDRPPYLDVSSGVMAGNLISAPMPVYPSFARMTHVQGEVILQAVVSTNGSVSAARVLSGPRLLRGAAVDAVRRWRYRPYLVEGRPVDVSTIVTLNFHPQR